MKPKLFLFFLTVFLFLAEPAFAHQPRIVFWQKGNITISSPELSQAFYDELSGSPRSYYITSDKDFLLYLNILVPEQENYSGRYSAVVFLMNGDKQEEVALLDGKSWKWQEFYEDFGRDYYLKGPELEKNVSAGRYKVEVFSDSNTGKYVLAVGKKESFDLKSLLNIYWQLPLLKMQFFKSDVLQFFLTPFGIGLIAAVGGLIILFALLNFVFSAIGQAIKHRQAKTMLLTSGGMQMREEILKLLQKPAYDVNVAFIITAAKPEADDSYVQADWEIMRQMGFNLEEVDIEGKKEAELMKIFSPKDIVYVEGGNAFYLLKAMRQCNFEKVMRKLMKQGIVYVGASAGSMVAGRTIQTANWKTDKENFGVKDLKGLGFVPFDVFVHYRPEHADIIKEKMPSARKRKKLKILTDQQAILVQGKDIALIGRGEQIIL